MADRTDVGISDRTLNNLFVDYHNARTVLSVRPFRCRPRPRAKSRVTFTKNGAMVKRGHAHSRSKNVSALFVSTSI